MRLTCQRVCASETGDGVAIGGLIISGTAPKHVLLRAIGPSLTGAGIVNPLADPVLSQLHGPAGFQTVINNNWRDTQEQEIIDTGIPPTNDLESAIVATLDPGAYTAIVRGVGTSTGVALVEIYDLNPTVDSKLAEPGSTGDCPDRKRHRNCRLPVERQSRSGSDRCPRNRTEPRSGNLPDQCCAGRSATRVARQQWRVDPR